VTLQLIWLTTHALLLGGCDIVLRLAPLVARQLCMDQVIALQGQAYTPRLHTLIMDLNERRRKPQSNAHHAAEDR
jgi:hypothetical protein